MVKLSELVDECRRRAHTCLDIAEDLEQKGHEFAVRGPGVNHP
jgi:hypothetical protein